MAQQPTQRQMTAKAELYTDEEFEHAMDQVYEYEKQLHNKNMKTIKLLGVEEWEMEQLLDGCNLNGEIEIVDKPDGSNQDEDKIGVIEQVYVRQWGVGMTGDSYAGYIYAKVKDKWLKIPYEC